MLRKSTREGSKKFSEFSLLFEMIEEYCIFRADKLSHTHRDIPAELGRKLHKALPEVTRRFWSRQ